MSAFYVVAYASLSVPAVLAGIVVTHISLQTTFELFGSVVAAHRARRRAPGVAHPTDPRGGPADHTRTGALVTA